MLIFSSQLALRDKIDTNKIHVCFFENALFCWVEFNFTYPVNKNGVFSSCALDSFGKIRLIQVSSIATCVNKELLQLDQIDLIQKKKILADRSFSNRIRLYNLLGTFRVRDWVIGFLQNRYRCRKTSWKVSYFGILNDFRAE